MLKILPVPNFHGNKLSAIEDAKPAVEVEPEQRKPKPKPAPKEPVETKEKSKPKAEEFPSLEKVGFLRLDSEFIKPFHTIAQD